MANEVRTNQVHALIEEIYREHRTELTYALIEELFFGRNVHQVLTYIEFIGANSPTIVTPTVTTNYNITIQYSA